MCTNSSFHFQVEDIICVQTETSIWLMLLIYSQIEKQPIVLILRRQSSFVGLVLHKVITTNAFKIVIYPHHPFPSHGYWGCETSGHPVLVSPVGERWGEAV